MLVAAHLSNLWALLSITCSVGNSEAKAKAKEGRSNVSLLVCQLDGKCEDGDLGVDHG
jgi:hypothetical protein